MKIGEKNKKPRSDISRHGEKKCRIKLVKRLKDDLFRNVNKGCQEDKYEHKKTKNVPRKETVQAKDSLTNHLEIRPQSLNYSSPEIDIDNVGKEEIIVTYCYIRNREHVPMEETFSQATEENIEMEKLRKFLSDPSVNPNHQGKYGETALVRAVQTENKTIVKTLLAYHRVDANLADHNGYTPLIWAADQGSGHIVKLLLGRRDIKVNLRDNNGYTALMWAVEHHKVARKLLRHDDLDVNIQDDDGHTALIWAADKGHGDVVRTLLGGNNIDPNIQNSEGFTALICAAGQGYEQIVRDLLENEDTDATLEDKDGFTALIAAANSGYYDIALILKHHMYPVQKD